MFAFYLTQLREIPTVIRGTTEAWSFWLLTVVAPIVVFFNPELKTVIETQEFSRWLAARAGCFAY